VNVDTIEYQYNLGAVIEILDYHEKNVAKGTEAQLRVSHLIS